MVIIKPRPLLDFMAAHPDAAPSLKQWMATAKVASWGTPNEVRAVYANASVVSNDRVVFNIGGNKYRLVVRIAYSVRTVYIRFIGTHHAYDQIDAVTI